jgi:uncharacterized protein YbaR (Trm112 family)
MTITDLCCDKCGKTLRIETDIPEFLEKEREKFEKKNAGCKEKTASR